MIQVVIAIIVAVLCFVAGFLTGEWLHGLGASFTDALTAAWNRFLAMFSPHGAVTPGSIRASDGSLVVTDGECHNGWSAYPGETTASRCLTVDSPEIA